MKPLSKQLLCLIIAFVVGFSMAQSQDYRGTDFRFAFLDNLNATFNTPPVFYISGFAIQDADIEITYSVPGEPLYSTISLSINAGESFMHVYDNDDILYQQAFDTPQMTSFHVTSTADIRVYATHFRIFFSEASPILPTNQLGNDYTNISVDYVGTPLSNQPSLFSIVGVQDNTEVHYIPSVETIGSVSAGTEETVIVNAGEVISIGSFEDLTGSRIFSPNGQPFAVFTGNRHTLITCNGADSHLYEQLLPQVNWRDYYPIIPAGGEGNDALRIIVAEDGTDIFSGCDYITTLNVGDIYETNVSEPTIYHGSGPFLPALFTVGNDCSPLNTGDPNMRIPLPLERANSSILFQTAFEFSTLIGAGTDYYFLHLVTNASNSASVLVNGNPVSGWSSFDGMDDMLYAVVDVGASEITNVITADAPFWAEYVAMGSYDVISLSLGSDTVMAYTPITTLTLNLGSNQDLCSGNITLDATTVGAQSYLWSTGATSPTIEVSAAGTYSVVITGACSTETDEIVISDCPPELSVSLGPDLDLCAGDDFTLEALAIGGVAPYTYSWTDFPLITVNELTSVATTNTSFTVTVTDFAGSTATATVNITVIPDLPTIDFGPDQDLCSGNITLDATTVGAQSYLWSTGATSPTIEVSTAGTYSVVITGACSTETDEIVISDCPPELSVSLGPDLDLCAGDDFTLEALAIGGVAPYTYSWTDFPLITGDELTSEATTNISITVTVTDFAGNTATATVNITIIADLPPIDFGPDQDLCSGNITLDATTVGAQSYLWSTGATSPTIEVSTAGTYSVVITGACSTETDEIVISDCPPELSVSLGPDLDLCAGDDFTLEALAIGGVAPYTYSWTDFPLITGDELTSVATTNTSFTVTVTDLAGSTATATVNITIIADLPPIDFGPDQDLCSGNITLDATTVGAQSYLWSTGATSPTIEVSTAGTYSVVITGACSTETDEIVISDCPPELSVSLGPDLDLCAGDDFTLEALAIGGVAPYTFSWINAPAISGNELSSVATSDGTFVVTVTDFEGAQASASVNVYIIPLLTEFDLGDDIILCPNTTSTIDGSVDGGTSYMWNDGTSNPQILINTPGLYVLSVIGACNSISDSINVEFNELQIPPYQSKVKYCSGESAVIGPLLNQEIPIEWSDGKVVSPILVEEPGVYFAMINDGCGLREIEVEVTEVKCNCEVYFPNAFTPNGDGLNDLYGGVFDCEFETFEFQIFNRWGELIFETSDPKIRWDGESDNPDFYTENSLYIWSFKAQPISGLDILEPLEKRGTVMMVR